MTNTGTPLTYNISYLVDLAAFLLSEGSVDEREVDPEVIDRAAAFGWIEVLDVGCYRQVLLTDDGKAAANRARQAAVLALLQVGSDRLIGRGRRKL